MLKILRFTHRVRLCIVGISEQTVIAFLFSIN